MSNTQTSWSNDSRTQHRFTTREQNSQKVTLRHAVLNNISHPKSTLADRRTQFLSQDSATQSPLKYFFQTIGKLQSGSPDEQQKSLKSLSEYFARNTADDITFLKLNGMHFLLPFLDSSLDPTTIYTALFTLVNLGSTIFLVVLFSHSDFFFSINQYINK